MPKRRLDFDDDQYAELEDLFLSLDSAIVRHDEFEYSDGSEYIELIQEARDYLQSLIEEVDDVAPD